MINNIKKAILNGGPIDEIVLSSNRTIEVKFNDDHRVISSNITPGYLGKCVRDYFKFQLEKTDNYKIKQINIVNEGLTETQFKKYKNRIVEGFHDLFGLKITK